MDVKILLEGMGGELSWGTGPDGREVCRSVEGGIFVGDDKDSFVITPEENFAARAMDALVQAAYAQALKDMAPVIEALRETKQAATAAVRPVGNSWLVEELNNALALYERLGKE